MNSSEPYPKLTKNQEEYLAAVYEIVGEKRAARAKEIAARVGVGMSSVTGAMRVLSGKGLLHYAPYEYVTLTSEGERVAREICRRHNVLYRFFTQVLEVEGAEAERAAVQMERGLTPGVRERLQEFLEFIEGGDCDWAKGSAGCAREHERGPGLGESDGYQS